MNAQSSTAAAVHGLSRAERYAAGAALRHGVPLEQHAEVPREADRPDPVELLVQQDAARLSELVPIRHGRMSASPFTFYRGSAAVMASDLSRVPNSGLRVQLCGDAHVSNFGLFNGPDRRLVFDLNDFDETLPGPFEWDLKRLACSVTVAGRNNGLKQAKIRSATRSAVSGYRSVLAELAHQDPLSIHYYRIEMDAIIEATPEKYLRQVDKAQRKALGRTSLRAFDKLTATINGKRRIVDDPPRVFHLDVASDEKKQVEAFFHAYLSTLPLNRRHLLERYHLIDLAVKVVGVGSVGTRCLIILLETGDGEPLFLQFKEATTSVLEPYLGPSQFAQAGERVVQGQRLMQATGDVFLGWARFTSPQQDHRVDFYFRQLWDGKGSLVVEEMGARLLAGYARMCGATLALAHARSGDAASIQGYLGDDDIFDDAVADFASAYADITERDHAAHLAAIAADRVHAVSDV
ncbi:DUF2252 domain-containing protein [Gordonia rhizosphera]|uniref:DUF2252 domain-containing protein n=1 Tax=Gordonia rhizosphera NBRC 16068 TaxID=1108045 RepID=K6X0B7_9ACTN|nr:DUF2252 domain-containing protein [Gordonia rhizosphera]GAB92244.1 hypothetical protein GORHZ_168_00420 [Gordonia rhizosphera NBRC 16068]